VCGICGFVQRVSVPVDEAAGREMAAMLRHRGPEGSGEATLPPGDGPLHGWFGHRRLKIIDLTEHAHQPMTGESGNTVLTYNGEIYNFLELRAELTAEGRRFSSTGDTEVLLRAYERWGERCVEHVDGMFAFAVWDAKRHRLVLARDRTGKKPLYYFAAEGRVSFASEIKGLLAAPWVPREPALDMVPALLAHGYVPGPATMYRGILQVPPGSVLVVDERGPGSPMRYWRPRPERVERRAAPDRGARIRELFTAGVERRMVSDVPIGAFLSGGIDSSLVVGVASGLIDEPLRTFSIGFPDEASFDERSYARLVAERFGTEHQEFAVEVDAIGLLDRLLWHHDQPFGDSSAVPTYIVSGLAREHVTVVLNGDGGDEVFGGYDRFRGAMLARLVPSAAGAVLAAAARRTPTGGSYHSVTKRLVRFLEQSRSPILDRYRSWVAVSDDDTVARLAGGLGPATTKALGASLADAWEEASDLPVLDRILYANFMTYLPDDLSVKVDRMSMAHSLEARSPFLDTALIDYAVGIPGVQRVGARRLKPVLREAFRDLLPDAIWDRRKHGFGVPMGSWFRGALAEVFSDEVLAEDSRVRDVLAMPVLDVVWREHQAGYRDHGQKLWLVLTLERWLRTLERPLAPEPPALALSA